MKGSLPLLPALSDRQARTVEYLRISLTDRCNYRCLYCMPAEGITLLPREEVMRFDEIERLVRLLCRFGVRRVRLTGGEPTVRKDLVLLVERLAALGLTDLALTTNGERLGELAAPLRQAGLGRLNVSVDTLDAAKFAALTRRGHLDQVLAGLDAARAAGFSGTKINTVVMGGYNDEELPTLCRFAWARGLVPRFIEVMPMSDGALFVPGRFVGAATMRAQLTTAFGALLADDGDGLVGVGPARYLRVAEGRHAGARLGIISAVTEPFCATCNRVRLSATGQLHTCLALDDHVDLLGPLRAAPAGEAGDERVAALVAAAVGQKPDGHQFTRAGGGGPGKHMVAIGG